jgi:hypothetical protein
MAQCLVLTESSRPSTMSLCARVDDSDFMNLYEARTAEYGVDLAKQFKRQQEQLLTLKQQQDQLDQQLQATADATTSAGFFKTSSPQIRRLQSVPHRAQRKAERSSAVANTNYDPWATTTRTDPNGDNLILIMITASMMTTTSQQQPLMISLSALLLCLSLSFAFAIGDGSPIMSTITENHVIMVLSL